MKCPECEGRGTITRYINDENGTVWGCDACHGTGSQSPVDKLPIFSGDYSRDMWDAINNSKTIEDLQDALYCVCCRLQELEGRIRREDDNG